MGRGFNLPYKASNPRTVRGAAKRNWTIVQVSNRTMGEHNISWAGLNIWTDRTAGGYYVSSFALRLFAFENPNDATFFKMKWG